MGAAFPPLAMRCGALFRCGESFGAAEPFGEPKSSPGVRPMDALAAF